MKYIIGAVAIVGYLACSQLFARKKQNVREKLNHLYSSVSGFKVATHEYDALRKQGADPTYGEITYDSAQKLLRDLRITNKDILYDLGSGVGKFVVQSYLTTPAHKVVGIELSPTRHALSQTIHQQLTQKNLINPRRQLLFIKDNIINADLSDATIIYMCSTCFSEELMQRLTDKFKALQPGLRVVTLKRLPKNSAFKLVQKMELPMTWSQSSTVFLYELII